MEGHAHGPSSFRRSINRPNHLDRLATFSAVNKRRAAFIDRFQKISQLVAVANMRDPPRVAGAGFKAGLRSHRGENLVVAWELLLKIPERDVVLLDTRRAAVAVDLRAFEKPRKRAGCG